MAQAIRHSQWPRRPTTPPRGSSDRLLSRSEDLYDWPPGPLDAGRDGYEAEAKGIFLSLDPAPERLLPARRRVTNEYSDSVSVKLALERQLIVVHRFLLSEERTTF